MLRPPGPKPHLVIGNMPLASRDPLGTFARWAAEYGDIFYYRAAWLHVYFLNRPDLIEYVLVRNPQNFLKDRVIQNSRWLLGNGLLTAEGDHWKRQRRIIQPAFARERITSYARFMSDSAEQMLASWQPGSVVNIHREMMHVTLQVVVRALFGLETVETKMISHALNTVMLNSVGGRLLLPPSSRFLPLPGMRKVRSAVSVMNNAVYQILQDRRKKHGEASSDLVSMLMDARDDEGRQMTDEQLHDEVLTFLLAGHETTALTVSWAIYLLGENIEAEGRLHEEVDRVLAARIPAMEDIPSLIFTEKVVKETMRLYPPAWSVARTAINEFELDGYPLLNQAELMRLPKAGKRQDMQRILESPNSEDYVTWNAFQLLGLSRHDWWSDWLKLACSKNPLAVQGLVAEDVPKVHLWQCVQSPVAYERASRRRMAASSIPEWVRRAVDPSAVEGASEIDVALKGKQYVIYIEAKLGSDISTRTTYDPGRNQIVRNIDCLIEGAGGRTPLFWMIARDDAPTRSYMQVINTYRSDTWLGRHCCSNGRLHGQHLGSVWAADWFGWEVR